MKLLIFSTFCLLMIFPKSLEAVTFKYLVPYKTIAVDYNDDKKPDLFIKKENGVTQHIFNNRSQVRTNISSVKVGEEYLKEFSRQEGDKWKLYRREKLTRLNKKYSQKKTEIFKNGKVEERVVLVKNIQFNDDNNDLPRPPSPYLPYESRDGSYQKILAASGDCYTLDIANLGALTNLETAMDIISHTDLDIKNFIDFDSSCGNLCQEDQSEIKCGNKVAGDCPINMPNFISDTIQGGLECMSIVNPELAAQLVGVIFSNQIKNPKGEDCPVIDQSFSMKPSPGCQKLQVNCFDKSPENTHFGKATYTCETNWPSLEIRNVGCYDNEPTTEQTQQNTILHEMIHLLGYTHGEDPDMAYACATSCSYRYFGTTDDYHSLDYGKENGDEATETAATNICATGKNYDGYEADLQRVMTRYEKGGLLLKHKGWSISPEDFDNPREVYDLFFDNQRKSSFRMCPITNAVQTFNDCDDQNGYIRSAFFNHLAEKEGGVLLNMLMFADPEDEIMKQMKDFYFEATKPDWILPSDRKKLRKNGRVFVKKEHPNLDLFQKLKRIGDFYQKGDLHYTLFKLDQLQKEVGSNILKSAESNKIKDNLTDGIESLITKLCLSNFKELRKENPNTHGKQNQPKNYAGFCQKRFDKQIEKMY